MILVIKMPALTILILEVKQEANKFTLLKMLFKMGLILLDLKVKALQINFSLAQQEQF